MFNLNFISNFSNVCIPVDLRLLLISAGSCSWWFVYVLVIFFFFFLMLTLWSLECFCGNYLRLGLRFISTEVCDCFSQTPWVITNR